MLTLRVGTARVRYVLSGYFTSPMETGLPFVCGHPSHVKVLQPFADYWLMSTSCLVCYVVDKIFHLHDFAIMSSLCNHNML